MGRHQPPTNRSFYLSVAASTLRFAIIVALVVGGVVVINQAFPDTTSDGGTTIPDGGPPVETQSPTPSASVSPTEEPEPSPNPADTAIAVYNAAGVEGLAGETQERLVNRFGYQTPMDPQTAPELLPTTTIYFRANRDRVEADYLANRFFRQLDNVIVRKLQPTEGLDDSVQVVVYLGLDYADSLG
jgi:LytR cell envelope-related transcriptional attenuator